MTSPAPPRPPFEQPDGTLFVPRLGIFDTPQVRVTGQATDEVALGDPRYAAWLGWINRPRRADLPQQPRLQARSDSPQTIINDLQDLFGSQFTVSDEDSQRVIAALFETRYIATEALVELAHAGLNLELSNKTVPEMAGLGMLAGEHPFGYGVTWETVPGVFSISDSGEKRVAVGAGDPALISADISSVVLKQIGRAMADIYHIGGIGWSDLPEVGDAFEEARNAGLLSPYYSEAGGEGVQEFLADAIAMWLTAGPEAVARTYGQDIVNFLSDKNLASPEAPWPRPPEPEEGGGEGGLEGNLPPEEVFQWPRGMAMVAIYEAENPSYQVVMPITPAELPESADADTKSYRIIGSGGHSFPDGRSERKYSLAGYFPGGPRVDAKLPHIHDWRPPQDLTEQLRQWLERKTRLRYRSTGRAGFYDVPVYLSRYAFTRKGHAGDIAYQIDLTEWRSIRVRVDDGTDATEKLPGGSDAESSSADEDQQDEPIPTEYTVKSGDTLWFLAKEFLGDSGRWPELYEENREVIGDNPHLIFPGQVVKIPGGTAAVTEEPEGFAPSDWSEYVVGAQPIPTRSTR